MPLPSSVIDLSRFIFLENVTYQSLRPKIYNTGPDSTSATVESHYKELCYNKVILLVPTIYIYFF